MSQDTTLAQRFTALKDLLLTLEQQKGEPVKVHLYDACCQLSCSPDPMVSALFEVREDQKTPWETISRDLKKNGKETFGHTPGTSLYWLKEKAGDEAPDSFSFSPEQSKARKEYIRHGQETRREAKRRNETGMAQQLQEKKKSDEIDQETWPDLPQMLAAFKEKLGHLAFSEEQVASLHLAWNSKKKWTEEDGRGTNKRFVIISGLSGTGKSLIVREYSNIFCGEIGIEEVEDHRETVAVSPDWRDPSGLLGYPSTLHQQPRYHKTPALDLLLRAVDSDGSREPYFLILEEMNLAHPERYMAPLLASMENGEPLKLHSFDGEVDGVPNQLDWPSNLFIAGTVNMDETTTTLSDKILDRAFTLEFWQADLKKFMNRRSIPKEHRLTEVEAFLFELNNLLQPSRRHFGYRTCDEILDYVESAVYQQGGEDLWVYVDQAVFAKALPKLRGQASTQLEDCLDNVQKLFSQEGQKLHGCLKKLKLMKERLAELDVTNFWS